MRINIIKSMFLERKKWALKRIDTLVLMLMINIILIFNKLIKSTFFNNKMKKNTHIRINLEFILLYSFI